MRTLKAIDADIKQVRQRKLNAVQGTAAWKTAMEYLDKLLDERLKRVQEDQRAKSG